MKVKGTTIQEVETYMQATLGVMFTQMSKKGNKIVWREIGSSNDEFLKQLEKGAITGKPVVKPVDPNNLTTEDKNKVLEAVNLIKEKRDGIVKGRICKSGSNQWK